MALSKAAQLALAEHLPILRDGPHARRYGWRVDMEDGDDECFVRLTCSAPDGESEHVYMLKLGFAVYPKGQPSAVFVDPDTRGVGTAETYLAWWPNVDGNPWINVQLPAADPAGAYLCFQWTEEFAKTHTEPPAEDPKRWEEDRHTVFGVVYAVQRALSSEHHKGYRQT